MKNLKNLLLVCCIIYLVSCTSDVTNNSKKLFNSASFIRSQTVKLKKSNSKLYKTAEYNGKKEILQLDSVNWNKELELIVACNIAEKYLNYNIDSIQQGDSSIITYTAKESKAEVRKFIVVNYKNNIKRISIERMKENTFYYSKQQIEYVPLSYFSIYAKEKIILSDTSYYLITGVIN
jgi:hypothetical protein